MKRIKSLREFNFVLSLVGGENGVFLTTPRVEIETSESLLMEGSVQTRSVQTINRDVMERSYALLSKEEVLEMVKQALDDFYE